MKTLIAVMLRERLPVVGVFIILGVLILELSGLAHLLISMWYVFAVLLGVIMYPIAADLIKIWKGEDID